MTALAKSPDIITAKALLAAFKKDAGLSGMFPLLKFAQMPNRLLLMLAG